MYKLEKCNVLVVDDEPGMTLGVQKVLRNFSVAIDDNKTNVNYEVDAVLNEKDFYKALNEKNYDLILLDYKLPNITGLELLEYIINNKKNTLVIMITAYATFETAVQSTKMGAYDFLAKPFSPEELRNSVKKATTHLVLARQAREYEDEKRKIRFQFISVLSHELKAPLNAIEGYINILNKRYNNISEEDYNNMLNRTQIRIEGMRKLIFDLLDLTRIESGEKKRNLESIDLIEVVKSSIELFSPDALQRNIDVDLLNDNPIIITGDKSELEIIFNNLISNAIKYNVDSGKVRVKIKEYEEKINILVADSGIGISKEDQHRLFQEFVRIKNEKTYHILGSGLGLSTLKKIVSLYNGKVRLRSRYERGSTFLISIKKSLSL
jgi:signal transduction histidine kinase